MFDWVNAGNPQTIVDHAGGRNVSARADNPVIGTHPVHQVLYHQDVIGTAFLA